MDYLTSFVINLIEYKNKEITLTRFEKKLTLEKKG